MNHRVILALLLSLCTFLPVVGQVKPADNKDDVVRITTNLVQIDVVVTKDGKPVPDLKAEDFEIFEDGRRQPITSFAFISNIPNSAPTAAEKSTPEKNVAGVPPGPIKRDVARRTIALVVDDLGLSAESIAQARRQIRKFIAEQVQPDDLVAVIRTGGEMGALQQFTNDKRLLNRAAEKLSWNVCSRVGVHVLPPASLTPPGMPRGFRTGPTELWCGGMHNTFRAMRFILDAMAQLPGRKSMIFMSDSMPIETQESRFSDESGIVGSVGGDRISYAGLLDKIAEKAIRSSVVIYSVDTQGLQTTGPTAADAIGGDPQELQRLLSSRSLLLRQRREGGELIARQTGGFQIRNSNSFQLDRILVDQSGYYLLGYRPTEETFNRRFHHIKAKVKRSGLTLRTRFGFFGVTEEDATRRPLTTQDETNLALISPFRAQDLELEMTSFFANGKAEGSLVRSFIYLEASQLTFTPVNDRHETALEVHGVIFGDNGRIVEQVKHGATFSLREKEYEDAKRDGLSVRLDMPVKRPGSYQVRIAVRDRTSSKIGSAGQFVAVPDLNNNKLALSGIVLRAKTDASTANAALVHPAVRRYRAGSDVSFAFLIYNARIDPATQLPNLMMETKLFRDGKSVGPSAAGPIDVGRQSDFSRLFTTGVIGLPRDLEPGRYYLQVVINDTAARNKQPPITQWVDFEIVK